MSKSVSSPPLPVLFWGHDGTEGWGDNFNLLFFCFILLLCNFETPDTPHISKRYQQIIYFSNHRIPYADLFYLSSRLGIDRHELESKLMIVNVEQPLDSKHVWYEDFQYLSSLPIQDKMIIRDMDQPHKHYLRTYVESLYDSFSFFHTLQISPEHISQLSSLCVEWNVLPVQQEWFEKWKSLISTSKYIMIFDNPERKQSCFSFRQHPSFWISEDDDDVTIVFMMPQEDEQLSDPRITTWNELFPSIPHPPCHEMILILQHAEQLHMIDSYPSVFWNILLQLYPQECQKSTNYLYLRLYSETNAVLHWYQSYFSSFSLVLPLHLMMNECFEPLFSEGIAKEIIQHVFSSFSSEIIEAKHRSLCLFQGYFLEYWLQALHLFLKTQIKGIKEETFLEFVSLWEKRNTFFSCNIPWSTHPLLFPVPWKSLPVEWISTSLICLENDEKDNEENWEKEWEKVSTGFPFQEHVDYILLCQLRQKDPPCLVMQSRERNVKTWDIYSPIRFRDTISLSLITFLEKCTRRYKYIYLYKTQKEKRQCLHVFSPSIIHEL